LQRHLKQIQGDKMLQDQPMLLLHLVKESKSQKLPEAENAKINPIAIKKLTKLPIILQVRQFKRLIKQKLRVK